MSQTFDQKINEFAQICQKKDSISNDEMRKFFGASSHLVCASLLSIPFLQPIPLPGLSTFCGFLIAMSGACIFLQCPLWIPAFMRGHTHSSATLLKIIHFWQWFSQKTKKLVRPRGKFIVKHPFVLRLNGLIISFAALLLSLPLPIPGTNFFPAWTIFLLTLGTIKEDSVVVIFAYIALALSLLYFFCLIFLPFTYF
jgi:hypothetical protein